MPRRNRSDRDDEPLTVLEALHARGVIPDSEAPISALNLHQTPVEWVFPGWIPAGKLSLLLGPFGIGKSLVSLDIVARITTGMCLPLCDFALDPSDVLIFAAQDGALDTICPRLAAAGADLSRINLFPGGGQDQLKDARLLELLIDKYSPALVIVDPVTTSLGLERGGSRICAGTPIDRVARIAEFTGAAILMTHSSTESTVSGRLSASALGAQYASAARSVMLITRDSKPDTRLLVHVKGNLAPQPAALRFNIAAQDRYSHPTVHWTEIAEYASADTVADNEPVAAAALRSAEEFLRRVLKPGRIDSRKLQDMATAEGIAPRTLRRARQHLTHAVRVDGIGPAGKWMVELDSNE